MAELTETEFERIADGELHRLLEALIECSDAVDPDLQSGVLTIQFDDDTRYVVNSHRAARQIWMAAERGAWHFDFRPDSQRWIASSNDELWSTLATAVGRKLGKPIKLR